MRPRILPLPCNWLASLCLVAMSVPGSLALAQEKSAGKTEAAAYAKIEALKPRKGDAELLRLAPAFLEKYPDSPHFEKVAGSAAEALLRKKDWKGALDPYLRLAERFPKSADIDRFKFQVAVCRLEMKEFGPAALLLEKFLKDHPASGFKEEATYRLAMASFFQNKYKETLLGCRAYLMAYPEGKYAGDILYRLAFIDFHDKEVDQSENIIKFLGDFIARKPADPAVGAMHCLVADAWLKRKPKNPADAATEIRANEEKALEHYRKAALSPTGEVATADQAHKAAEGLLTKHGEGDALREFQAEYRKQLEARARKTREDE